MPGPRKNAKYLYGNRGENLNVAIEKQIPLRISMQLAPDELRSLRDFMDLYDIAEPTHAFRLAVNLCVTTGSKLTEVQRLKARVISNELRDWLLKKTSLAFKGIADDLRAAGIATEEELARAQAEYAAVAHDNEEGT